MSHDHNIDLNELGPVVELCTLDPTPPPVDFKFCDLAAPKSETSYVSPEKVRSNVQHYWPQGGPTI